MNKDNFGVAIQAFPLSTDKVNLTSGTLTSINLIHCVANGSVTITWTDTSTDVIACVAGDDFTVGPHTSVTITSGTFHVA